MYPVRPRLVPEAFVNVNACNVEVTYLFIPTLPLLRTVNICVEVPTLNTAFEGRVEVPTPRLPRL